MSIVASLFSPVAALFPFHGCAAIGMSTPLRILCAALQIYWFILLIRILLSWFPTPRSGAGARFVSILFELTDPILRPLRNLIPPARAGAMAIDFSPILVFIGIGVIQRVIGCF
ncbi:MAG TPA: YggT family protein [Actinomycetota bacterium]|nr:YggT family protein [Actinomycetota bacterium]